MKHVSTGLYMDTFSFMLGKLIRMGLLDGMVSIDSTLEETAKLFSKVVITLYISTSGI